MRTICLLSGILAAVAIPGSAMHVSDFERMTTGSRADYLSGAVSMMAFNYAANDQQAAAACIFDWFFKGVPDATGRRAPAKGPQDLSIEIAKASRSDPNLHVEEIVLGMVEKTCSSKLTPKVAKSPAR
jgi:hypothetical protein